MESGFKGQGFENEVLFGFFEYSFFDFAGLGMFDRKYGDGKWSETARTIRILDFYSL